MSQADNNKQKTVSEVTVVGFALTLGILLFGGVLGFINIDRIERNEKQVANTHATISGLEYLLSRLKDAETGQRGYLLTHNPEYLLPYRNAVKDVESTFDDLMERLSDDPDQQARLVELRKRVRGRVEELRLTIAMVDAGNPDAAVAFMKLGSGKLTMDDVRSRVAHIQEAERARLAVWTEQSRISALTARVFDVLVAATGTILVCAVFYVSYRRMQDRKRANALVASQRELLRVTLASIGDAVITTDIKDRITFINDVAKSVTGWSDDAVGRTLHDVFRVIDETTRKPMDTPWRRAMREGVSIGLPGHGILIRRDGSERPIDDSMSPIKDGDGNTVGCVLIFRDITDRRRLETENASQLQAARLLAAIVESSADAIVSKSLDSIIQTWNLAAERLFGYAAEEVIGKNISLLIPADRIQEEEEIIRRIRAGDRVDHFETVRVKKNGQQIHLSLTISPIRDEKGNIIGASKIARDITDRKEAEERIYGLLADLKAADQRKDEFLAILAHELRAPLAPLRNCLEIMKRGNSCDAMLADARTTMDRQLGLLVRLVDDLLDVSRITRNKIELRRERLELSAILEESVQACQPLIESKNLHVSIALPSEPIYLDADQVRMVQVFTNIIHNACKYTNTGGQIWVATEAQDDQVLIKIRDNGMGIPADRLDRVFDMFAQVDRTLAHSQGGLGIGLTLVKRLVEMHEGSVEAHSDGPGKGSEFVVRLPISSEAPKRESRSTDTHMALVSANVLVVDDNVDAARSLATLLKLTGNETHVAHDGMAAIEAAEKVRPDLILLDIGLPKLNGLETCRRIRQEPWGKSIIIVALTGWGQEADRRQSKDAGFNHHLVKPVNYNELLKLLAESLLAKDRQPSA